jgi:hypothetical protein
MSPLADPRACGYAPTELRTLDGRTSDPSLLILGADAILAAQPATPVQLAHACLSDGFDHVIPGSWGDELVAEHMLGRVRDASAALPALQCSCPRVLQRLAAHADDLAPMTIRAVPPPIAVARYLRAVFAPSAVLLTYAGACPAGADSVFETWLTPEELFMRLDRRGIDVSAQPTAFDAVLSPDRRRYWSDPGGLPHPAMLGRDGVALRSLASEDIVPDVADLLLSQHKALIDIALSCGCACSGATSLVPSESSRSRVTELEPPRSASPVIHAAVSLDLSAADAHAWPSEREAPDASRVVAAGGHPPAPLEAASPTLAAAIVATTPPRRTPSGVSRAVLGAIPLTRREGGRQLPRAYIARRRSSPRGLLAQRASQHHESSAEPGRRRALIVGVGALGLGVGLALAWLARLLY